MSGGTAHWRDYGPWEVAGSTVVRTQFVAGDPNRPGFIIADLTACPLDGRAEIARLIAAAPRLVSAAVRYFAAMDELRDTSVQRLSPDDPRFAAVAETRAELRAALAQAEGGEA